MSEDHQERECGESHQSNLIFPFSTLFIVIVMLCHVMSLSCHYIFQVINEPQNILEKDLEHKHSGILLSLLSSCDPVIGERPTAYLYFSQQLFHFLNSTFIKTFMELNYVYSMLCRKYII